MQNILAKLKKHSNLSFSGKFNLLYSNGQLFGTIFLNRGNIVNTSHNGKIGEYTFSNLFLELIHSISNYKVIIEPEIIKHSDNIFSYSYIKAEQVIKQLIADYKKYYKLKPPNNILITISSHSTDHLTAKELYTLNLIKQYSDVSMIFNNSIINDLELIKSLVSLRKKRAITPRIHKN